MMKAAGALWLVYYIRRTSDEQLKHKTEFSRPGRGGTRSQQPLSSLKLALFEPQ
jgi:hypothetical protein